MKFSPLILLMSLISTADLPAQTQDATQAAAQPPAAPRIAHQEQRHGETVNDNYYWLREKTNPAVVKYLEAENTYTSGQTKSILPFADALYTEMLGHIKQTDLSVPVRRGSYLYYSRTEEGKQYPIQCRKKGENGQEEALLDLNQLAQGHKFVGMGLMQVSDDQNLLAYTLDFLGFRQYSLHVKDLRTGETLPDTTERVTSVEWAADNKTLYATTEDAVTKRPNILLRHALGSAAFDTIYEEKDELYDIGLDRSRDKKYVFLQIESKDTSEVLYTRTASPQDDFHLFLPRQSKHRYYVDHREGLFYIRTNKYDHNFDIVTAPDNNPDVANWKTFVAHEKDTLIEGVDLFQTFAAVVTKSEALNHIRLHNFQSNAWTDVRFPEPVYAAMPGNTPDYDSKTYRYSYQSFITPQSVYDYDTEAATSRLLKREEVLGGYDPAQYASERLWATARDGVKVPISIVYKKGFERNGKGPLFLYAYGSYGYGMSATFSIPRLSLLDRGMAYAITHIRGGDEMGEGWREDGMLMKKKNTFQDFVDSAKYLVAQKWTSPDRLVIEGASAGGLLMGAVVNMNPELFKAVHLGVPFVDVMNTMMDASLPLTVGEYLEWGNPNDMPAYNYMKTYSPYDNLEKRAYPAMLVTSSFNDSQVMYWEPAKYVARLRTVKTNDTPLLLKMKMEPAGHGGASGRYDRLKDASFEYAWMLSQVGINH